MQAQLSVLPPGFGPVLQRLGRRRRLVCPVRRGRPRLTGGRGPQPATFDLRFLLGLAARAALGSAQDAVAGPSGDAALERGTPGETAAGVQRDAQKHPTGTGPEPHRVRAEGDGSGGGSAGGVETKIEF